MYGTNLPESAKSALATSHCIKLDQTNSNLRGSIRSRFTFYLLRIEYSISKINKHSIVNGQTHKHAFKFLIHYTIWILKKKTKLTRNDESFIGK